MRSHDARLHMGRRQHYGDAVDIVEAPHGQALVLDAVLGAKHRDRGTGGGSQLIQRGLCVLGLHGQENGIAVLEFDLCWAACGRYLEVRCLRCGLQRQPVPAERL